ncbi:MAG TPA: zinc-binding dehydrogenase, partial [Blastocatellia bacterium]|nr:zinc-binding dehydrogenase [Blastocatellia bacterium]
YVIAGGGGAQMLKGMLLGPFLSVIGHKKMRFVMEKVTSADLDILGEFVASGKLVPVIDRRYPLSDVAEAVRYVLDEHARGKIVITVEHHGET